ncbi:hypothetical protein LX36DRAFT_291287 [Colletotrichum falcatum]|nr:hypothetical protein LX36DRAFT_291287 [Colletotrichum falcatum]
MSRFLFRLSGSPTVTCCCWLRRESESVSPSFLPLSPSPSLVLLLPALLFLPFLPSCVAPCLPRPSLPPPPPSLPCAVLLASCFLLAIHHRPSHRGSSFPYRPSRYLPFPPLGTYLPPPFGTLPHPHPHLLSI